jgi:anti-sigma regulatory factor (Ser/Thr protein kinase)
MTTVTELPSEPLWAVGRSLLIGPQAASVARAFTGERLGAIKLDAGHVDDVVLVVAELAANAVVHGAGGDGTRNVHLELCIWSKWTHVAVDDRDPNVYDSPANDDPLAESGRGLLIVRALSERFWWHPKRFSKTANAVILRPGVRLTGQDTAILNDLQKGEL